MTDPTDDLIFIGIKGSVLALDRATGVIRWSASLKGSGFVNLVRDQNLLFASTRGVVFCLDAATGSILWTNGLEGFGFGIATILAGDSPQNLAAIAEDELEEQQHRRPLRDPRMRLETVNPPASRDVFPIQDVLAEASTPLTGFNFGDAR